MILDCLTDLCHSIAEAIERYVNKMLENDMEYRRAVAADDLAKARGLENLCMWLWCMCDAVIFS